MILGLTKRTSLYVAQYNHLSSLLKKKIPSNELSMLITNHMSYKICIQIIYQIKLPGPAILGEGKPENQNHAIIFTRGEGLQTIDMNQVY